MFPLAGSLAPLTLARRSAAQVITDSFDRADAASLGTADTGQTWTTVLGTPGITGNQAANQSAVDSFARIDPGYAGVDLQATFNGGSSDGLLFRFTDTSNYLRVRYIVGSRYQLLKIAAGVPTVLGEAFGIGSGQKVLRVTAVGTTIKVYGDGVLMLTVTESFNATVTPVGIFFDNNTSGRINDFSCSAGT